MNRKQFVFVMFLIWSAINTGLLFVDTKVIEYVSGKLGIFLIAGTFVTDCILLLFAIVFGLIEIYNEWFGDD